MKKIQKALFISIFLFAAGILASAQIYTWTGGHGNFKNPSNWSPNLPAGTTPAAFPAGKYKILSAGPCYLTENITFAGPAQIEVGSETDAAGLQLAHYTLLGAVTVTVNKKGTLELSGTPAQIALFNNSQITLQPDSTVWYYGGYPNNIFPGPYQNFKVTGNINADSLTVEKTTSIGNSNPVTIKVKTQTYKGAVTVQKDVTFDAETSVTFTAAANVNAGTQNLSFIGGGAVNMQGVTAGTVDATGASSLTVNGTVTLSGDLKAKNLTVNTATVSAAKIEVSQAATVRIAATITAPTQTYTGKITAKNGSAYKNIIFITGSATGTGLKTKDLTAGNITVNGNWDAGDHDHPVNIEANGDIEVTGNFSSVQSTVEAKKVSGSGGNITVNTANTQWRCWGDITAEGNMIIKDMKASGGTIKILGNLTAGIFHFADYGKLLFRGSGTKTISFTNPSEIRELEIASGTTLNLLSDIKITHKFTNNGTFAAGNHSVTLTKANKIDTLDPDPIPSEIIITGTSAETSTQFKDLDCTDSYIKTLTINGKISIAGDLKLQGQSAASPLTVQGDTGNPHIALSSANSAHGQFLEVRTNIPITGGTYTAENSIPVGSGIDIQAGKPENWIFTNYNGTLTWKGSVDSTWNDRRNWEPALAIPGKNTDVTIPVVTTQYPKLTAAGQAKSITVDEKASLDLVSYVIKKDTGADDFTPLINKGTLRMMGTVETAGVKGQKEWLENTNPANKITHLDKSTIEYYNNSADYVWIGPYKNLTLNSRSHLKINNQNLTVQKKLTIKGSNTHIDTGTGTQTYEGEVDAKNSSVPHWNIEFTASSLKMEKGSDTLNINAENIKVNATTWTSSANINAASITANGSWTSKKGNIKLRGGLTVGSFNQENGAIIFNGNGGTLKYTSASGQVKIKTLNIASSATVNLGSDIIITEKF
ncbi:hypothetical protein E4N77_11745 [Treponema denticola]|nr:hypothetical protein [Treponema denticola]UTY27238.1 hypothetical protein E4N77_11745 [Treponema denticola]